MRLLTDEGLRFKHEGGLTERGKIDLKLIEITGADVSESIIMRLPWIKDGEIDMNRFAIADSK